MKMSLIVGFVSLVSLACQPQHQRKELESDLKIVNGNTYSSLPAIGAIVGPKVLCTGTLITPTKVLTAAHCLRGISDPSQLHFLIGSDIAHPQQSLDVASVQMHKHYNDRYYFHDIGVVHLRQAAPESIVPLPIQADLDLSWTKERMFVVGFGINDGIGNKGSGLKRAAWMPINKVGPYKILALAADGVNTCRGDSGGPALHMDARGDYAIVGITVSGFDTSCKGKSVFTRVDAYRGFIEDGKIDQPGPEVDPCPGIDAAHQCSADGRTPASEGRFQMICTINPWQVELRSEDCLAKGDGFRCKEGKCVK